MSGEDSNTLIVEVATPAGVLTSFDVATIDLNSGC